MLKQIMIPVAAFAVTVTSASAFTGNSWWSGLDSDLSDGQRSALEEAQQIRETAREQAQAVLDEAGLDEETMRSLHEQLHQRQQAEHEAVQAAVEADDYSAFKEAIAGSPIADVIKSESDFEQFVTAHELMQAGDFEAAREIMDELGMPALHGGFGDGDGPRGVGKPDGFGGPGRS